MGNTYFSPVETLFTFLVEPYARILDPTSCCCSKTDGRATSAYGFTCKEHRAHLQCIFETQQALKHFFYF